MAIIIVLSSVSFAQSKSDSAKGMYFKFQGRVKAGMGQTCKPCPQSSTLLFR